MQTFVCRNKAQFCLWSSFSRSAPSRKLALAPSPGRTVGCLTGGKTLITHRV